MSTISHKKAEKNYYGVISKIISEEVHDSKISFPTVTGVVLSNDKYHLKIFLTFHSYPKQSIDNLRKAKGFIKMQMSKYMSLKRIPKIELLLDDTFEKGKKIDEIFKKISEGR